MIAPTTCLVLKFSFQSIMFKLVVWQKTLCAFMKNVEEEGERSLSLDPDETHASTCHPASGMSFDRAARQMVHWDIWSETICISWGERGHCAPLFLRAHVRESIYAHIVYGTTVSYQAWTVLKISKICLIDTFLPQHSQQLCLLHVTSRGLMTWAWMWRLPEIPMGAVAHTLMLPHMQTKTARSLFFFFF